MSTNEDTAAPSMPDGASDASDVEPAGAVPAVDDDEPGDETPDETEKAASSGPNWWHRTHPVFTPLSGFYTGLVVVIVLPAIFGALLSALVDENTAEKLVPFALVVFGIPLTLIAIPRTRRFGRYMLLGMVLTAVVVLAVGAATLLVLYSNDG